MNDVWEAHPLAMKCRTSSSLSSRGGAALSASSPMSCRGCQAQLRTVVAMSVRHFLSPSQTDKHRESI